MSDELDKIAERGRERERKAKAAQDDAQALQKKKDAREREQYVWESLSRWSLLTGDMWLMNSFWMLFVPGFAGTILLLVKLNVSNTVGNILVPGHGRLYFPWPVFLVATAIIKLAPRFCRRAVERERAFIASLPFAVKQYEDCLGDYHRRNESEVTLILEFAGDRPEHALLVDVLKADGGEWKSRGDKLVRQNGPQSFFREDDNRKVVRWFHKLVREQLLPLHAKYPLRSVTLGNNER
jgi:hypothetical protein